MPTRWKLGEARRPARIEGADGKKLGRRSEDAAQQDFLKAVAARADRQAAG
eukprot:SAG11_NODE_14264_length_619_cov_1.017308_1_plen_51_part_00